MEMTIHSKGWRLTPLIRSTLSNMPIYFMSLLRILRKVKMRLEKIQREFLWGGGALERKIHLVKWKTICSNKDKGGLGVKSDKSNIFTVKSCYDKLTGGFVENFPIKLIWNN